MTLDPDRLLAYDIPVVEQDVTPEACMLYALGIGLGADPMDEDQLRFVYEEGPGLLAVPTMAVVLGYAGGWMRNPDAGVDYVKVVHGEQAIHLHKPLPTSGRVVGRTRVTDIIDKGAAKGALVYQERVIEDRDSGEKLATLNMSTFARGDGGCGERALTPGGPPVQPHPIPDRDPDLTCVLPTVPQAALIYRLNGDRNPLHADPAVARKAGFDRPILHGLCTLGVAGHAILKTCCGYDPARFKSLSLRFSAPVFPGETIRTEMWDEGNGQFAFRSVIPERKAVVINNGKAVVA